MIYTTFLIATSCVKYCKDPVQRQVDDIFDSKKKIETLSKIAAAIDILAIVTLITVAALFYYRPASPLSLNAIKLMSTMGLGELFVLSTATLWKFLDFKIS